MTDSNDDHEQLEASEIDEAAAAFEALRRAIEKLARDTGGEMVVIRKGVEAAFEQFEKFQQPLDYSEDLGQIMENQVVLAEHLAAIEKSPALKNGPEHYARMFDSVAERISANVGRVIEDRGRILQGASSDIEGYVRGARQRRQQDRWLLGAAMGGIIMGAVFLALGPRLLPGSVDAIIAATVMNADRWEAGISLMRSGSPGSWRSLMAANDLVRENQEELTVCVEAAAKTKKQQRCTITVEPRSEQ
ncbi:hypothetical protein RvVAR0630_pl09040 (plasmid) [Agrobacterium vitis]|uniref:DUF6118 family protein n=1 Tax=Agrobacterium vitis TaxID=373 RepID=UPI0015D776DD|nr:DUF6118 family protein [Agrobacterium vitis]BCH62762.1 hypothetical protein RvVAR0630_pl09040 [Agrobacterium vitis]